MHIGNPDQKQTKPTELQPFDGSSGAPKLPPWRVLLPVGLGTALSLLGDTGLYTVLPTHTLDAGVLLASVGILLSANRFVRLISNGAVGWLSDRWPRRRIFVPALFLGAISTAIYALSRSFPPLLVGRLLWGIAWSGIWIAGNAIVLDIGSIKRRGFWVGIYHVSFFLGAAMGAFLGGWLTDRLGYHWAMGVAASLTLLGAIIAWFFLPETKHLRLELGPEQPSATEMPQKEAPALNRSEIVSATALNGINRIVIAGMILPTFGVLLLEILGEEVQLGNRLLGVTTLTGLALGASTLMSMGFTPLAGWLSDKVVNRWRIVALGLAMGICGVVLLAYGLPLAILVGLPLVFFASSSNQGLSTTLVGDFSSKAQQGRALGTLYTVGDLGSAIGPPLAFALLPSMGISIVYWISAGLFGLMFLLAISRSLPGVAAKRESMVTSGD